MNFQDTRHAVGDAKVGVRNGLCASQQDVDAYIRAHPEAATVSFAVTTTCVLLHSTHGTVRVRVQDMRGDDDSGIEHYALCPFRGMEITRVNFNVAYTNDVFWDYVNLVHGSPNKVQRAPFSAYLTKLRKNQVSGQPVEPNTQTYSAFIDTCIANLLNAGFGTHDCLCPICGPYPRCMVFDASSIGTHCHSALPTLTHNPHAGPTMEKTTRRDTGSFVEFNVPSPVQGQTRYSSVWAVTRKYRGVARWMLKALVCDGDAIAAKAPTSSPTPSAASLMSSRTRSGPSGPLQLSVPLPSTSRGIPFTCTACGTTSLPKYYATFAGMMPLGTYLQSSRHAWHSRIPRPRAVASPWPTSGTSCTGRPGAWTSLLRSCVASAATRNRSQTRRGIWCTSWCSS